MENTYLGDGVYASFDGFQIWLSTREGHRIALDPGIMQNLVEYIARYWKLRAGQ